MKRIMILLAVVLGITVAAVALDKAIDTKNGTRLVENETWYFRGDANNDPTNPSNYANQPTPGKPCGLPFQTICEIQAPADDQGKPIMSAAVEQSTVADQIQDALAQLDDPELTDAPTNTTVIAFRAH